MSYDISVPTGPSPAEIVATLRQHHPQVVYVLTVEPYHENSTVLGVFRSLDAAQQAFGPVGPCRCLTKVDGKFTTKPPKGSEEHSPPGWTARDLVSWWTTCETPQKGGYGQIERCDLT